MKFSFFIAFVLNLLSIQSYAFDSNQVFSDTTKTKYQILQDLFATAQRPAQLEDFVLEKDRSQVECASVTPAYPQLAGVSFVPLRHTSTIPGEPSHGPLFPGTPETTQESVIFVRADGSHFFDVKNFSNSLNAQDFIITVDRGAYIDHTYIRVNGPHLVFYEALYRKIDLKNPLDEVYGYCWRK